MHNSYRADEMELMIPGRVLDDSPRMSKHAAKVANKYISLCCMIDFMKLINIWIFAICNHYQEI